MAFKSLSQTEHRTWGRGLRFPEEQESCSWGLGGGFPRDYHEIWSWSGLPRFSPLCLPLQCHLAVPLATRICKRGQAAAQEVVALTGGLRGSIFLQQHPGLLGNLETSPSPQLPFSPVLALGPYLAGKQGDLWVGAGQSQGTEVPGCLWNSPPALVTGRPMVTS